MTLETVVAGIAAHKLAIAGSVAVAAAGTVSGRFVWNFGKAIWYEHRAHQEVVRQTKKRINVVAEGSLVLVAIGSLAGGGTPFSISAERANNMNIAEITSVMSEKIHQIQPNEQPPMPRELEAAARLVKELANKLNSPNSSSEA